MESEQDLYIEHALGLVSYTQYEDEAVTKVTLPEIIITNKYNARLMIEWGDEREYAADFLSVLGRAAINGQDQLIYLSFISPDGKPTGVSHDFVMLDNGMLVLDDGSKDEVGYLLGASRDIDGFISSVLDANEVPLESPQQERQLQLV